MTEPDTRDVRRETAFTPGFDDVDERAMRARRTVKWSTYGSDVLPAWIAEMDFRTAPVVLDAIRDAVDREQLGYAFVGDTGLREAIADWSATHWGHPLDPARINLVPDVLRGVELAIEYFSPESSSVILPTPAYMPFFDVPPVLRRRCIEVPLRHVDRRYSLDLEGIAAAFEAGAGTLILCQPYNPVGRLFSRAELAALAEVVDAHHGRVVSDEIHAPHTFTGPHVPYASVSPRAAEHTITLVSASKAWNLAGLSCAAAILGTDADQRVWDGIPLLRTHGVSPLGIVAGRAAFTSGEPWLRQALDYLDHTRAWLTEVLAEHLPQVGYTPPEATYFAWLDCRKLALPTDPAEFFLERARVAVNPGPAFGAEGEGFVRLNLATSRSILTRMVSAMGRAVATERGASAPGQATT